MRSQARAAFLVPLQSQLLTSARGVIFKETCKCVHVLRRSPVMESAQKVKNGLGSEAGFKICFLSHKDLCGQQRLLDQLHGCGRFECAFDSSAFFRSADITL